MTEHQRIFLAIDLKSFYASAECADRGLDPLTTNLVVADTSRTEKTICLAVSPSLKALGIPGRPRLFEVVQKIREINAERLRLAPCRHFTGHSANALELAANPALSLDYLVATPRMARYLQVSAAIYAIYLRHVAPRDLHVYSIDEVFLDATDYLALYHLPPREFATRLVYDVFHATGITATCGIGTNLFLAKVAMDIVAKHLPPDEKGVRIAELDEAAFRRQLWNHRPLTDFWRIGHGIAARLAAHGMTTLGDVARTSLDNEEILYRLFGVNAELLIDHAWGWEPCTIADIKAYRPNSASLSSGQVLMKPYDHAHARLVVREMADRLALDLFAKQLSTKQLTLYIGYDHASLHEAGGLLHRDHYGRPLPAPDYASLNLPHATAEATCILDGFTQLFDRTANPRLLVRRINLAATRLQSGNSAEIRQPVQLELFADDKQDRRKPPAMHERELRRQQAILAIHRRLGRNALFKGMALDDEATTRMRNRQIGGHQA